MASGVNDQGGPDVGNGRKNNTTRAALTSTYGGRKDPNPWAKGPNDTANDKLGIYGPNEAIPIPVVKQVPLAGSGSDVAS